MTDKSCSNAASDEELKEFCSRLPKIELHAHIGGSVSDRTIQKLVQQRKVDGAATAFDDSNCNILIDKGKERSFTECFRVFDLIHSLVNSPQRVYEVTCSVLADFAADGVIYLELRTQPRQFEAIGSSKADYLSQVLHAFRDSGVVSGDGPLGAMRARLLVSINRRMTTEEAEDVLNVTLAACQDPINKGIIVGVDFSGDPYTGTPADFVPVLKRAKSHGLYVAIHIAEVPGRNSELLDLLSVPPDRLGHATYLHPEVGGLQEAVDIVESRTIPIELCLTSNLKCNTVKSYSSHQLKYWMDKSHRITIGTDDSGVFGCTLSSELAVVHSTFGLTRSDLIDMTQCSIQYAFCDPDLKQTLHNILASWMTSEQSK